MVEERALVVDQACGEGWVLYLGDSAEVLRGLPSASIDLSIYSPPFSSLYVYSASERDLGNSAGDEEFFRHYGYITSELLRVTRPGRLACVHVQQLVSTLATHGVIEMRDFRGEVIRHHREHGWLYHGEVVIQKNPQSQAVRTKSKQLLFVQLHKDSSWLRPALADYILLFRAPGENAVPIRPDITNDEWINYAHPVWHDIRETHTLNVAAARENEDERHLCALQLDTIERCVRLWSNEGETILSPFAGIGSEGYVAVRQGRRFIGIELRRSYFERGVENLREAERLASEPTLFDLDNP